MGNGAGALVGDARSAQSHVYNAKDALQVYEGLEAFRLPFQELYRHLNDAYHKV